MMNFANFSGVSSHALKLGLFRTVSKVLDRALGSGLYMDMKAPRGRIAIDILSIY